MSNLSNHSNIRVTRSLLQYQWGRLTLARRSRCQGHAFTDVSGRTRAITNIETLAMTRTEIVHRFTTIRFLQLYPGTVAKVTCKSSVHKTRFCSTICPLWRGPLPRAFSVINTLFTLLRLTAPGFFLLLAVSWLFKTFAIY